MNSISLYLQLPSQSFVFTAACVAGVWRGRERTCDGRTFANLLPICGLVYQNHVVEKRVRRDWGEESYFGVRSPIESQREYRTKRVSPPRSPGVFILTRELKQQRRRRLQKRHLKSEFALLQTLPGLFHLVQFGKKWRIFLELNSNGLYWSSGKEKENCCLVFTSYIKTWN